MAVSYRLDRKRSQRPRDKENQEQARKWQAFRTIRRITIPATTITTTIIRPASHAF